MHSFKKSLDKGLQGELALLKYIPCLLKLNGRRSDFIVKELSRIGPRLVEKGETLELKTDFYRMAKTENFFIEVWSDVDKGKPGGPMQAQLHGSTYWLYMYFHDKTAFLFKTEELCEYLEKQDKNRWPASLIPNKTWTTMGMRVPREDLKHLYTILTWE